MHFSPGPVPNYSDLSLICRPRINAWHSYQWTPGTSEVSAWCPGTGCRQDTPRGPVSHISFFLLEIISHGKCSSLVFLCMWHSEGNVFRCLWETQPLKSLFCTTLTACGACGGGYEAMVAELSVLCVSWNEHLTGKDKVVWKVHLRFSIHFVIRAGVC